MSITKHMARAVTVVAVGASLFGLAGCSTAIKGASAVNTAATNGPVITEMVTVGYVSNGADDAWTVANDADIRNSFTRAAGFDLKYSPGGTSDQKSQIDAFGALVDDGVDVIMLSTPDATGWESALRRAKDADIPVILIDGGIEPDDASLYVTHITAGHGEAAKAVANWGLSTFPDGAKYYVLEGPSGVDTVTARNAGWDSVMADHPEFVKVGAQPGGSSAEAATSVTAAMLEANANDVQLIVAQDDEMGLGAAQAVTDAGLTPGVDVKIATIGGSKAALQALLEGRLSFVSEFNPLLGTTAAEVVNTIEGGATVDSLIVVPSHTFASITQEELDARPY